MASAEATSLVPENVAWRSIAGIARFLTALSSPRKRGPSIHKMAQGASPCPYASSECTGSPAFAGDDTEENEGGRGRRYAAVKNSISAGAVASGASSAR